MIARDELLTKLAAECATWDEAADCAIEEMRKATDIPLITKKEWIAERERLLNKPVWPDDKEWKWRAMDKGGKWYFYKVEPLAGMVFYIFYSDDDFLHAGTAYKIPAGYDWRESLEERAE